MDHDARLKALTKRARALFPSSEGLEVLYREEHPRFRASVFLSVGEDPHEQFLFETSHPRALEALEALLTTLEGGSNA